MNKLTFNGQYWLNKKIKSEVQRQRTEPGSIVLHCIVESLATVSCFYRLISSVVLSS
jgi:hypothetical protein